MGTEHELYKDSASIKKVDNGYLVIMAARNTASPVNDSYNVEKFFKSFKGAWGYLEKILDPSGFDLGHMINIETEY